MNKSIKSFIIIPALIIVSGCILAGCFNQTPNSDDVKNDLNKTEFIDASELYKLDDGEKKTIPVTEVLITDGEKDNETCSLTCTVIQENENYKKETQLIASYYKQDNWVFDTYNTINTSVLPVSGVPDEILRYYSGFDSSGLSDITHNFDTTALTDMVSWNYIVEGLNCIKTIAREQEFRFETHHDFGGYVEWGSKAEFYKKEQVTNREWKYDELEGSVWRGDLGFGGVRSLRINSIDTVNHTMNIDYGYSDLKYNEVCSYEIRDYQNSSSFGKPAQALVMSLTYDVYEVEILENGIWFGASLNKIEDSNNVNTKTSDLRNELRIGWSEFKPLNYYNGQNELVGFDTELAKYVCEYYGWKPIFVEIPFDVSFASIQNGTIDCYWSGMAKTKERMEVSDFTDVYLSTYIDGEYEDFSVPCTKGDSELVNKINKALQAARENGTIQDLKIKYGLK